MLLAAAPRITADLANVTTVRGSSAILHCIATGDPIPIQSWSRNGVTVLGSRFQISSRGDVLSVNSVRDEDGGLYTCHASNPAGNSSANITLTVNCEFRVVGLGGVTVGGVVG